MMKDFDDHLDNYGDPGGYYGQAGTRNPEEPASAAYMPVSGLTNDGLGRMTPDYSMVNQASVWGPTRLDPFPPGVPAADITALLAYNWRDEEVDYYNVLASQDISAEELNKTHIFAAMNRINEWITRG
jgi:hypothetical protein